MDDIQTKAIKVYQDNLAFFKQNNEKLHEKIILLETAIANEVYAERYSLEYKPEGYFDVLELESGEYFYGSDSKKHAESLVTALDFSRINGVFEAQRFVDFSPEMPDIIDKSKLHINNGVWATIKIIEYAKKVAPRSSTMKAVHKLLFLGVGLGIHIPMIVNKMGAKILFVREHNLELFRLSLFVTNYARLGKQVKLFFSIMEDQEQTQRSFIEFLETGNNYNLYLKQISLTREYEEELLLYQNMVMAQDYIMYPYSAYLLRYIDSPRYIAQGYSFIKIARQSQSDYLADKPVLLLLAGPSLAKNAEWVKANQEHFIIVTALAACKTLHRFEIKPNIVVHIDPAEEEGLYMLEGIEKSFFENVVCLFSGNVHPRVVECFHKDQLHFIQQATNYKYGFGSFSSVTVGEYTYGLLLIFGVRELYLLGMDLALDPDTLESHSPGHHHYEIGQRERENASLDKTIVDIAGNFLPTVPTQSSFLLAIQEFERFTTLFKSDQRVYNLSNGAFLNGTEPKKIAELDMASTNKLETKEIHEKLTKFFDSIGSKEFRKEDRDIILYQLKEAKKLKDIIERFKKTTFVMPSLYLEALARLNYQLSDMEKKTNSDLAEVYYLYFKIILSYIFEIFNTENLTNIREHIKSVNAILVLQLEKILYTFIDAMEGYLKESE